MQDSNTYLMILDEGQEKRAKKDILLVGGKRLGQADESIRTRLNAITNLERVERMILQAVSAASWEEILGTP